MSVSHSIIISGDDFNTKNQIILDISKHFTCKNSVKPCGVCNICIKTDKNINPDIYVLDNADKIISIDDIRKIIKDAYIPPNESEKKVYIIKNAQNMNINSSNACLKILEEPPFHVRFILSVDDENMLLDTILSRCSVYRFNLEQQVFSNEIVLIAEYLASNIDNELNFLSYNYKNITKAQFIDVISILKIILKDSLMFAYNSSYMPFCDVSREIFLNKNFAEIVKIYDICDKISNMSEYNISVLNLAYYFITEIKKGD